MKFHIYPAIGLLCLFVLSHKTVAQAPSKTLVFINWHKEIVPQDEANYVYVISNLPTEEGWYPTTQYEVEEGVLDSTDISTLYQQGFLNSTEELLRMGHWETFNDGILTEEGDYLDGLKTGLWTNYYKDGSVRDQGTYQEDEMHGDWMHYYKDGEISGKLVYDAGDLTSHHYINPDGSTNPDPEAAHHQPEFPGGETALYRFLSTNIKYPEGPRRADIEGRVYIQFVVLEDGTITREQVVRGVDPELDAEALRVVKMMPQWEGGMDHNRPVKIKMIVPITYKLSGGAAGRKKRQLLRRN
ncbi:MAG: TonB family protein [Bacteroidota bacterium]